nr:uracil-DNA glycosylase [Anaerolineae bacterium]
MTEAIIRELVSDLVALPESDRLTNPYAPPDDPPATIRRQNLERYLEAMGQFSPHILLLAEAPGYRGCRLTGIPVTSERIMLNGIGKWQLFGTGYQPTSGNPAGVAEVTATILWRALSDHLNGPPLIWNTLPLHPHKPGNPQSNRTPTTAELTIGIPFISRVLELYDISLILGVGRKAQLVLTRMGLEHIPLRHPSQGGKAAFIEGLIQAVL